MHLDSLLQYKLLKIALSPGQVSRIARKVPRNLSPSRIISRLRAMRLGPVEASQVARHIRKTRGIPVSVTRGLKRRFKGMTRRLARMT